ncbi:hypothetical protein Dimus_022061 [Dionaea muscipula]
MAETYESETTNGDSTKDQLDGDVYGGGEAADAKRRRFLVKEEEEEHLYRLVKELLWSIFFPEPSSSLAGTSLYHRAKVSLYRDLPRVREASRATGSSILKWTRGGSSLRALLVISVGTISLLTLTGLLVFMLFFVATTVSAIIISLLMSSAAVGGFLALFFASLVVIYIGALSVALVVISTATVSAVIAVLITTGWVGFLWTVWLAARKSASLVRKSFNMTGSAITAYSSAWHANRHSHHHHD